MEQDLSSDEARDFPPCRYRERYGFQAYEYVETSQDLWTGRRKLISAKFCNFQERRRFAKTHRLAKRADHLLVLGNSLVVSKVGTVEDLSFFEQLPRPPFLPYSLAPIFNLNNRFLYLPTTTTASSSLENLIGPRRAHSSAPGNISATDEIVSKRQFLADWKEGVLSPFFFHSKTNSKKNPSSKEHPGQLVMQSAAALLTPKLFVT